jgi:LSD1 subclass zinc finger protein
MSLLQPEPTRAIAEIKIDIDNRLLICSNVDFFICFSPIQSVRLICYPTQPPENTTTRLQRVSNQFEVDASDLSLDFSKMATLGPVTRLSDIQPNIRSSSYPVPYVMPETVRVYWSNCRRIMHYHPGAVDWRLCETINNRTAYRMAGVTYVVVAAKADKGNCQN